ncbi:MAG: amidase domain-containing protein [Clostridia bacterium]|nr:amidase domain-containing protein [Clostridia bacterium]
MKKHVKNRIKAAAVSVLAFCTLLLSVPAAPAAPTAQALNCHETAQLWFGDSEAAMLAEADENSPEGAAYAYFCERESDFPGTASLAEDSRAQTSDKVGRERAERIRGIEDFEARANVAILDADVTAMIDGERTVYRDDGFVELYVYEWTFYDYDDLSDGAGGSDVAGHGTHHKLTLAPADAGYEIISDEYDESDLYGVNTAGGASAQGEDDAASDEYVGEETAVLQSTNYYAAYDPDKAVAYADKYVYNGATSSGKLYENYYNSAYANFNDVGGDCANYTSQCIYAGGMPQVKGAAYGTDCWFYVSSSNRSATWTSASRLCAWMGDNRGVLCTANNSNIYKGSPCFHSNKSHATICVGKNSAGTHVINSHNYDRYHVVWSYISGTVYTVRLTPRDDYKPSSQPAPQPAHTTHTKGAFQYYTAAHPHYNYYKCSVCGEIFTDGTTTKVSSCTQCYPVTETTKTGYAAGGTQSVDINRTPSSGSKIGSIPEGAPCTVYPDKTISGWYYVEYRGISGYAYSGFILFTPPPPSGVWLKIDKTELAAGEKLTFTYGANNVTGYVMGIDRVGEGRIVTPSLGLEASYTLAFNEPGTYTAYVTAYNTAGSTESARVTFEVCDPVPAVPVPKADRDIFFAGESVTLSWPAAENAAKYEYAVGEYPAELICESPGRSGAVAGLSVSLSGLSCGEYTAYVRSVNAIGTKSEYSAAVTFTVSERELSPVKTAEANGRVYELYDCETSWTFARRLCEQMGGRLACVTDERENALLTALAASGTKAKYFIGASNVSPSDYNEKGGAYAWESGEAFSYSAWADGEPLNVGSGVWCRHFAALDASSGKWRSVYNTDKNGSGFILEREADAKPVSIASMKYDGGAVTILWNAADGADGYAVYRKADGGEWTCICELADTSYTDADVTAGGTYTYAVRSRANGKYSEGYDETAQSVVLYAPGFAFDAETGTLNGVTDKSAEKVIIPGFMGETRVTAIGAGAFSGCAALKTVFVPEGVTRIDEGAFSGCASPCEVYYEGTREQWDALGGEIPKGTKLLLNARADAATGETAAFGLDGEKLTVYGDVSADAPVYAAVYGENGRLLSVKIITAPAAADAGGAARILCIWTDARTLAPKCGSVEFDLT